MNLAAKNKIDQASCYSYTGEGNEIIVMTSKWFLEV